MKKTLIVLLCFLMTAPLTHASFFSMGPRVGVSTFRVKVNAAPGNTAPKGLQLEDHWGYHGGAFTRFDLLLCYVQPEILFTSSGAKFKKNNKAIELSYAKLDIPIMLGFSFFKVLRVQLGPVFSRLLGAKEGEKDVKEHYSSITTGWQAGLGVDIWKVGIDLKYESSLSKFGEKIAGISTDHGHAQWILSIGFNIL
jgi:hypothetical protein